jgi:hypothetical protein
VRQLPALASIGRALACVLLAWAGDVRAQAAEPSATPPEAAAPPERVRVSYALGPDCPLPETFEAELEARLGTGWKAAPDELARTLSITATAEGGVHVVRMDFQDRTGRPITRSAHAATCAEALHLMALITVVAIDAQVGEPRASAAETPKPASERACPACPAAPPCREKPSAKARSPEPEPRFVHEAGLRFGAATGFGPGLAFGSGLEWAITNENAFGVRVALEGRSTGSVPAGDGRARFNAFTARGELCFVTLSLSSLAKVPLCGGLEAGALIAEGVSAPPAVTFTRASRVPWVAGLLAPRLRLTGARVFVELMPEVRLPLIGHTFLFAFPQRTAHEIPVLAFGAAVATGARFR